MKLEKQLPRILIIIGILIGVILLTINPNLIQNYTNPQQEETIQKPIEIILPTAKEGEILIHSINVGQADSTLIMYPNHEFMLIDTGASSSKEYLLKYLKDNNAMHVKYLILTHHDADHIGGTEYLFDNGFTTQYYIESIDECQTLTCMKTSQALKDSNAIKEEFEWQQNLNLPLTTKILNPNPQKPFEGRNNNSIVLLINNGNENVLLTGDCETECENEIIKNFEFQADVYKVGHHGSRTSTSNALLELIQPKLSFISVGLGNRYGHPAYETIQRLNDYNSVILRTDEIGSFIITIDNNSFHYN